MSTLRDVYGTGGPTIAHDTSLDAIRQRLASLGSKRVL